MSRFITSLSLSGAAFISSGLVSHAQMGPPMKEGEIASSLEALYIYQSDAKLDAGGDFGIQSFRAEGGAKWGLAHGNSIGFELSAGWTGYSFSNPTDFGGVAPWDDIQQLGFDLQFNYQIDRTQSLFFMPGIRTIGESGADFSDSLTFGGIAGYAKQFSRTLTLGIGGAVYGGLEDTRGFPVILVYWQFAEEWRLSNPFRPGPSGPAGLEVIYTGLEGWELSAGASYRSNRFALDDSGVAPGGYGENEGAVLFLRATHDFTRCSKLDFYLGTMLGGELKLDDSGGDRITSVEYDPNLVLAVAYTYSF